MRFQRKAIVRHQRRGQRLSGGPWFVRAHGLAVSSRRLGQRRGKANLVCHLGDGFFEVHIVYPLIEVDDIPAQSTGMAIVHFGELIDIQARGRILMQGTKANPLVTRLAWVFTWPEKVPDREEGFQGDEVCLLEVNHVFLGERNDLVPNKRRNLKSCDEFQNDAWNEVEIITLCLKGNSSRNQK